MVFFLAWTSATPWLTKETRSDGRVKLSKAEDEGDPSISPPVLRMLSAAPCCIARVCNYLHEVLVLELGVVSPQCQHARLHSDRLRKRMGRRALSGTEGGCSTGIRPTLSPCRNMRFAGGQHHSDGTEHQYQADGGGEAARAEAQLGAPGSARRRVRAFALRVVRAFVQMRELISGSKELAAELNKLEAKLSARLDGHEVAIVEVLRRIMELLDPPPAPPVQEKSMGFHTLLKPPAKK